MFNKEEYAKGFGVNKKYQEEIMVLVNSQKEVMEFESFLKGTSKTDVTDAIWDYRMTKIMSNTDTYEMFEQQYYENPVESLQKLFQRPVLNQDVDVYLINWMERGNTLKGLWEAHKENPHLSLLRIIH